MTGVAGRLLIVDDEVAQMRALCDTLAVVGYAPQGFSSAQHALDALRPGEFDLMLTDLMMPEMDGIALINSARKIDAALGAVVMTGHGTIDTAVQAMQGGALDYILKPFNLTVILPVIARALDVQRLRRENVQLQERERQQSEQLAASEARVRAANLELERRVAEQTAELRATNARLSEALVQRTGALNQRDILLREVYHRVKNNLQLVDSLLQIQARHLTDPEAKSALISLRRRVYALGLVHHQLMDSTNLKTFDIGPFLQELSNNLVEAGAEQGVSLAVRAIPLDVGLDIAIPLGLIVTELVSNALKHAFPDGSGNILVSVESAEDGNIALIVSDDGQGQAGGQTPSDQPKSGTGTRIIATLVNQLNGTITVRRDHGTRTEIRVAPPAPS